MNISSGKGRARLGLSMVEVLVVIAAIGILLALIMPAMLQSRKTARNTQCQNNLRQVGLAMHNYADVHGVLPPGMFNYLGDKINDVIQPDGSVGLMGPARSCWMQQILPFIDQQTLYDQLPFDANTDAKKWGRDLGAPIWTVVPTLMCPSDPVTRNPKVITDRGTSKKDSMGFHGNVIMCAGSTDFGLADQGEITGKGAGDDLNGMFYGLSSTQFEDISDGLSNTVMGAELILNPDTQGSPPGSRGVRDVRGRYYSCYRGNALFSTQFPPNTSIPDEVRDCEVPNPMSPCNTGADVIVQYARSYHAGGVNVVMADGSGRFVSENISTEVFRGLGTRAGSEQTGEF